MDYERIQNPQSNSGGGGGLSPGKLRNMLLGMDKKRREDVAIDSASLDLRSQVLEADDISGSSSDNCKDVDVVNIVPDSDMKSERVTQRASLAPFSKPAPSKWDDAQKWIASPTSNRSTAGQAKSQDGLGVGSRKAGLFGYGARQLSTKVVVEVPDQRMVSGEPDTKRIDSSQTCDEGGGHRALGWEVYPHPAAESYNKPVLMIENSIGDSAINLSQHDSLTIQSATTFIPPPSTARSVSMRDMGTEMTPAASQEPSRTGTPVKATTPTRSPSSSRPSTPPRVAPPSSHADLLPHHMEAGNQLSQKELQMQTRREIIALGTQLGKLNIAAWASKEDEDNDASTSLKTDGVGQPMKSPIEARALAWEEAERAKYMARFKREEMKIEAWENHQKAKSEAEMRKAEVDVERIRAKAQDKIMNKLAAARIKAEEKRAAAEARRNRQAAKTEQQTDYIRRTGRIPSSSFSFSFSFSLCGCCS